MNETQDAARDTLDTEWFERSRREAAALVAETSLVTVTADDYDKLTELVAKAWRAGHLDGMARARKIIAGAL